MRRWPAEMPFLLALAASALIHAAALMGPGWAVPALDEPEAGPPIEAVLTRPPAPPAVARAAPQAAPRPPARTRSAPVPDALPATPATASAEPPAAVPSPLTPEPVAAVPATEPPAPVAIALPARGELRYVVLKGEGGFVVGRVSHVWRHDGLRYELRSVTETTGIAALFKPAKVVQESRGEVTPRGLRPLSFRHERAKGLDTAEFDWTARTLLSSGQVQALPGDAQDIQDMLSMYYQLAMAIPRADLELPIATGRKLERYRFEFLGETVLKTPRGERPAIHLRARGASDRIEVWLAPEGRGLPLQIRFVDRKGEIFDQLVEELAGEPS